VDNLLHIDTGSGANLGARRLGAAVAFVTTLSARAQVMATAAPRPASRSAADAWMPRLPLVASAAYPGSSCLPHLASL
jgi:hypothetical protein